MKSIFALFGILTFALPVCAQFQNSLPHIIPVKPDAAALFKPVDKPIGSFSGTVPVDIPIYTIKEKGVSIPILISYATGGIKVEEIASSVGLGWSLTAGGNITRVMNGKADDMGGMLGAQRKPSEIWAMPDTMEFVDVFKGYIDSEPDMYYYNINGRSGKFFFTENGDVLLTDQQPLNIQPVYSTPATKSLIKGWIVLDEAGRKYYLGMNKEMTDSARDFTTSSYYNQAGINTVPESKMYWSAWQLMEIRDMNDTPIAQFEYKKGGAEFTTRSYAHKALFISASLNCEPGEQVSELAYCVSHISDNYLKKITTDKCTVEFLSTTGRKDYGGAYKLDAVVVFDHNNSIVKRVNLSHGYFSQPNAPSDQLSDNFYKRLKLNYLAEYGSNISDSLIYSFEYIEDVNLPSRMSAAIDYWGYYNGRENNTSTIPNGSYTRSGQTMHVVNEGDRRPDPIYSRANTLRKVNFPTGGYREFLYENNQTLTPFWTQMQSDPGHYIWRGFEALEFPGQTSWEPRYEQEFTVSSTNGGATLNFSLTPYQILSSYSVKIKALSAPGSSGTDFKVFLDEEIGTVYLPNGLYRFEIYHDNQTQFVYAEANWLEENLTNVSIVRYGEDFRKVNSLAGGLRIKEVRDYEHVSDKLLVTKYQYRIPYDTSLSSGLLISPPIFFFDGTCSDRILCSYSRLSSSSCYPLSAEGGSYVYYPEVRVIEEGNGYTDREYSFSFDMLTWEAEEMSLTQPVVPKRDNQWKRGKLLVEKRYSYDNTLLSKNETQYPFLYPGDWNGAPVDSDSVINLKGQLGFKVAGGRQGESTTSFSTCIKDYVLGSRLIQPKVSINTLYTNAGAIETRKEYYYYIELDKPVLKLEKTFLNNNKVKEIEYRYAFNNVFDFQLGLTTDEQVVKNVLLTHNYMLPLETITNINVGGNRTMVEGTKKSYQYFNGQQLELRTSRQYLSPTGFQEFNFSDYDVKGNLLEQYKLNDVKEAYIWGYNNRYPVARIIGSDYNTAIQLINTSVLNNSSSTQGQIQEELNKLRVGLPHAHVTTYTYYPLLGISSLADSKGDTQYYEYDAFGRLRLVRDQDGKIIRMTDYKYKCDNTE